MMELRLFIKNTLLDIVNGIKDAQEKSEDSIIVPKHIYHLLPEAIKAGVSAMQVVDFQIAVEVDQSKGTEGKLGVVNAFVGAGVSGKSSDDRKQANIIKFKVPVMLNPSDQELKTKDHSNSTNSSNHQ